MVDDVERHDEFVNCISLRKESDRDEETNHRLQLAKYLEKDS
jgi:hypothetical protein